MSELKPCPFCGGEASVKVLEYDDDCKVWGVFCEQDLESEYSHGHFVDNYPTEAEAIEAWNTRAECTCHDRHGGDAWCFSCDACGCVMPWTDSFSVGTIRGGSLNYCPNCGAKVVD